MTTILERLRHHLRFLDGVGRPHWGADNETAIADLEALAEEMRAALELIPYEGIEGMYRARPRPNLQAVQSWADRIGTSSKEG